MVLDFDTREFLENLRATKPPYECPIARCGKIYKSFAGIDHHLHQSHAICEPTTPVVAPRKGRINASSNRAKREKSPSPATLMRTPAREALTYAEAQRMIEVDIDGSIHRININEPLNIVYIDGKNGFNVDAVIDSRSNLNDAKSKTDVIAGKGKNKDKSKTGKASKRNNGSVATGVEVPPPEQAPKLPEPSFRVIENYKAPEAHPRPSSYFRYIDKSQEELDDEVEYDMDEEDCAWLDLINSKRKQDGLVEVEQDTFELLMDRLEKESYFLSQNSGKDVGPAIDEDAVCCICNDGECQNTNAILFCDMCNLAVHQECYGVPYIPEGQWLCRRCLQSPSRAVDCVLCPNKGGAFKQTDDNRWTHVVCALWIPEVCFANTVFLEPIDSIDNIPSARWKLTCYICKQRNTGACIQCHKTNCYVAFHVTCAQQAGLYMKMEAVEERVASGNVHRSVRKAAYCHSHAPSDENGSALSGVYNSGDDDDSRSSISKKHQLGIEAAFKEKMKKARKILAEKRSAMPVVSIPTIPPDRLMKTADMIHMPKRNQFIQRLLGYWTLKRQSRNGVPLLRRLQISYTGAKRGEETRDDDEQAKKMKEELKSLQRLRQDLERARLLIELIRKREKLKRESIRVMQLCIDMQSRPFSLFLKKVLHLLEAKDTHKFFAEPVNTKEVPDYLEFINDPMDFSTMRTKINNNQYTSFSQFEADFHKIIDNCVYYNDKETVYYKAACRLRDTGRHIIKEAKLQISRVGYNEACGTHLPSGFNDEPQDDISRIANEQKRWEEQLKELNEDLHRAQQAKSGGSKTKKLQILTSQIAHVKRQMSLLNPTGFTFPTIDSSKTSQHDKKNDESAKLIENIIQNNRSPRNGLLMSDADCITSPLKSEGRRTMNSVSSVCFNELLTPRKDLKSSNESPNKKSKSRNRVPLKNKSSDIIDTNGEINSVNDETSKTDPAASSPFSSLSPLSSHTANNNNSKTYANLENGSHSRCSSFNKSPIHRTLTADASTCTSTNMFAVTSQSLTKDRANRVKKRTNKNHGNNRSKRVASETNSLNSLTNNAPPFPSASLPQTDSFKVYRSNLNSSSDSDAKSESSHSSSASSSSSGSSATSRSYSSRSYTASESSCEQSEGGTRKSTRKSPRRPTSRSSRSDVSIESQNRIPLEPLDLVWAKCRGYPWYPALIVNPDMPKTGYFHNGVPIPVPPDDVLALKKNHTEPVYLVLFFDAKRTWQWLPRNKLEPLGVNTSLDKAKLTESRKQADKKAVKKAFEKAIIHRCRVTGESTDFSGDSSNED